MIALKLAFTRNKLYKTLDYWSRDMLNFDFLERDLGIVSPPRFVYYFYVFNLLNVIDWLSLLLEILGNMCIAIVCFSSCDAINFEINLIFLIKPGFFMTKKSRQNFKYLKNEKSFQGDVKSISHQFKRLLVAKYCLRPESASLNQVWRT